MCCIMCITMCRMATKMSQPVVRRPNLPLTAQDQADLEAIRDSPVFRRALEDLAPSAPSRDDDIGESVLLHAVFEAGLLAIRRSAQEEGYAELAQGYAAVDQQWRSIARRRRPAWADDA